MEIPAESLGLCRVKINMVAKENNGNKADMNAAVTDNSLFGVIVFQRLFWGGGLICFLCPINEFFTAFHFFYEDRIPQAFPANQINFSIEYFLQRFFESEILVKAAAESVPVELHEEIDVACFRKSVVQRGAEKIQSLDVETVAGFGDCFLLGFGEIDIFTACKLHVDARWLSQ